MLLDTSAAMTMSRPVPVKGIIFLPQLGRAAASSAARRPATRRAFLADLALVERVFESGESFRAPRRAVKAFFLLVDAYPEKRMRAGTAQSRCHRIFEFKNCIFFVMPLQAVYSRYSVEVILQDGMS